MRSRRNPMYVAATLAAVVVLAGCGGSSSTSTGSGTLDKAKSSAGDELVVLADDQHLQTVDNVVPVVNAKVDSPALEQALNAVSKVLTTDDLLTMNKSADIDRKSPAVVASAYVDDKKLATGVSGGSGKLVVGAANFGESQILANIYADVLKAAGFDASVKPVTNREVYEPALERGDIDGFAEYAGTLTEFLNKKANGPKATALATGDLTATVTALRGLAEKKGLKVLDAVPGGRPERVRRHEELRHRQRPAHAVGPEELQGQARARRSAGVPDPAVLPAGAGEGLRAALQQLHLPRRRGPADQGGAQAGQGPDRSGLLDRQLAQHLELGSQLARLDRPIQHVAGRGERARPARVVRARRRVEEVQVDDEPPSRSPRSAPLAVSSR